MRCEAVLELISGRIKPSSHARSQGTQLSLFFYLPVTPISSFMSLFTQLLLVFESAALIYFSVICISACSASNCKLKGIL